MPSRRRFVAFAAPALMPSIAASGHAMRLTASVLFGPALTGRASAQNGVQTWPTRFVRLIVPFPPGGGTDNIARAVAAKVSEIWGQQMVVENRGGAATNIGTEAVVRADPDGYTILLQSMPLAVNRFLFPSISYDPIADLSPISLICDYPNIMAVPISSPAHSVQEFIAYAKAHRGKVTFASSGHGTSVHLSGELFKRMAGIEMLHVPYRGAGPALNDLIPGRVDVMFNNIGAVLPLIQGGKLRGLAVTTAKRAPVAPELPTIAEEGLPGFDVSSWYALFAPAKTPQSIIRQMHSDTVAALGDADIKARLEQNFGVTVVGSTPQELGAFLKAEMDKWGPVIKEAGIRADQ
jgi:tripartite-type tricarboxylate transporter receptor subunit TctC